MLIRALHVDRRTDCEGLSTLKQKMPKWAIRLCAKLY